MKKNIKKTKNKIPILIKIILFFAMVVITIKSINYDLQITNYTVQFENLPDSFDGYKIVQISDLHKSMFGEGQSDLINAVINSEPDLIVFTGDMIDKKLDSLKYIEPLVYGIKDKAPIIAINGNHELEVPDLYNQLKELYKDNNITLLEDEIYTINKNQDKINIYGSIFRFYNIQNYLMTPEADSFNILLYHASNRFDIVKKFGYDFVLSGHNHGGIIRLPLIGGLINNSRSLFPKYDLGLFEYNNTQMIVSAGLGDAYFSDILVPRINNPPEIVIITLKKSYSAN